MKANIIFDLEDHEDKQAYKIFSKSKDLYECISTFMLVLSSEISSISKISADRDSDMKAAYYYDIYKRLDEHLQKYGIEIQAE